MPDVRDPYAPVAEHLDLMSVPFWQSAGPVLGNVLGEAGRGPVLDIGAGTGMGLVKVAAMLPRHDIVAVEPSPALRVGLFARLSEDPALAARVTVLPVTVQEAVLPSPLGAVVGINMLGHLPPADRVALWARLAAEPAGPGQVRWRVTYRVHDGETLVSEQVLENDWWVLDHAVIEDELRRCGLEAHTSDYVLVARRPRS